MKTVAGKPRVTKINQVKEHLEKYGSITSWQSINKYRYTRLSDGVFTLKKRGMNIVTTLETKNDKNGNPCTFAVYTYLKPEEKSVEYEGTEGYGVVG